jgi:putative aldouronate transport system permease protein
MLTDVDSKITIRKQSNKEKYTLFFMAIPFMIFVIAFNYMPLFGWIYAFFDYHPGVPLVDTSFTGISSFIELFSDKTLVSVLINTLALSFLGILFSPVPVIFAILLNEVKNKPFKRIFQTISTLPYFVGWVIVASLAFSMFSNEGLINLIFIKLHLIKEPLQIMGNASIVWIFQTLLGLWKSVGWNSIIYLAAITAIDSELYDAAKVDGANRFKAIWHITVPGVIPTYLVLLLLAVSSMLSVGFEQYLVFYNGMVADKITVLDLYTYRLGILIGDYSYATAVGIFKTIVGLILLFSVNNLSKKLRGTSIV